MSQLVVTNEQGLTSEPDSVSITVNAENETPLFEGILGSGNNINIQVKRILVILQVDNQGLEICILNLPFSKVNLQSRIVR